MGAHLNLNQLRYFHAVARAKNMKRAAARMGVSQPALSKQIQALEDNLGFVLFFRSSRGMVLTPDGEQVFAHAERVFGHVRDLEEAIEGLRSGDRGRVAIGAVNSIGVHILPLYLRRFRQAHPQVKLRLITRRAGEVLQHLKDHRIDIGVMAGKPNDENLTAETFLRNPLHVVTAPDHPFARRQAIEGSVPAELLDDQDMVAFDDLAPTRHITMKALAALEIEPKIIAESPDIEVIKRLVEIGMGFAVLPEHCMRRSLELERMVAIEVEGFEVSRDLYVVYRNAETLPPAAKHFVDLLLGRAKTPDSSDGGE